MNGSQPPRFWPGPNIAVKVPSHVHDQTVAFYRDTLGLRQLPGEAGSVIFDFDGKRLWIDPVPHISQAEVWLEIRCRDIEAAADWLRARGIARCDQIEPLPDGFPGFWILSPANIVHLVCDETAND